MPEIARREFLAQAAVLGASGLRAAGAGPRRTVGRVSHNLQGAIRGHVFERGRPGYALARQLFNPRFDGVRPAAVARPLSAADVRAAVRWAVARDAPLRVRSGGHSYGGYSTLNNGVVLDLRKLSRISVDRRSATATIGAGAQLIDVYEGLAAHGVTLPAGSCPSVGIAGVALGGGMGLAARKFGLTCDNLLGARIVTADGRLREIDRHSDPDLLWALRGGGGGNFGIVTDFTFRVHPLPRQCSFFILSWPWSQASAALAAWQAWAPHAPDHLGSVLHLEAGGGSTAVRVAGQHLGSPAELNALLAPLLAVPGALLRSASEDYMRLQLRFAGCLHTPLAGCHTVGTAPAGSLPRMAFRAKSDYVSRPLSGAGRATLISAAQQRLREPGSGALLLDAYGGAINRVPPRASAFVHRNALFCVQYITYGGGADWLRRAHGAMRPYVTGSAYQNYIDPELTSWEHAYYGANLPRLEAVRRRVDPEHRFNFPQAIGR